MKKTLLLLFITISLAVGVYAAKAIKKPLLITQADGTTITVLLNGDEHYKWYTTLDGKLLFRDKGMLRLATAEEQANQNKVLEALDRRMKEPLGSASPIYFPHTGTPRAVVILAEYSDVKFTLTDLKYKFDQFFNATKGSADTTLFGTKGFRNYGSVSRYFHDISFGKYTPQFDVVGPVTLPNTMAYYGSGSEKTYEMVSKAISLVDDSVDFSQYTTYDNGQEQPVMVFVIYAGYSENAGGPEASTWSKSSTCNIAADGVAVKRYCVSSELNGSQDDWEKQNDSVPCINGIGVIVHEFSHAMGLPDIYPTNSAAQIDNQEMEYWDLMDGGEYTGNCYRPTPYTAWEREVMGWMTIDTLTAQDTYVELTPVNDGGKAYRILNDSNSNEYMVLENIQRKGWCGRMYGHGMIVYHVKWPGKVVNMTDRPNNTPGKPGMALVPADSAILSSYIKANNANYVKSHYGDPFPGTSNVGELNDSMSIPNFLWYNNTPYTNKALRNITEDTNTGIVSFVYVSDNATSIERVYGNGNKRQSNDDNIYTIGGINLGNTDKALSEGVYIYKGKKVKKQ